MKVVAAWWRTVVFSVLAVGVLAWVVLPLKPFQECVSERENDPTYQPLHEKELPVVKVHSFFRLRFACGVHVVGIYQAELVGLSGVAVAFFTFTLWRSTRRLWRVSERALTELERAFVFLDGIDYELAVMADNPNQLPDAELAPGEDPANIIDRFVVQPRWRNSGRTPTRRMTIRVDWRGIFEADPANFLYAFDTVDESFFLGPQAVERSGVIDLAEVIPGINNGEPFDRGPAPDILVYGRADYQDVFGAVHFTQWCYRAQFQRIRQGQTILKFIQWGGYNRTDDSPG